MIYFCNQGGELTQKSEHVKTYSVYEVEKIIINAIRLIANTNAIKNNGIEIDAIFDVEKCGVKAFIKECGTITTATIELR